MIFFDSGYQYFFIAIPIMVAIFIYSFISWRKKLRVLTDFTVFENLLQRSPVLFYVKQTFFILAIFFFVLTFLRPRWGTQLTMEKELGIDLAIAIDISNSMNANDIPASRLRRVISEIQILSDQLQGNRLGLVLFSGAPFIQCPLTADLSAIKLFLNSISTDMINLQGTNIEDALKKCADLLKTKFKRNKVILLFTDGEAHEGNASSIAKDLYKKNQIRVFTIGVGTRAGSVIPNETTFHRQDDQGDFMTDKDGKYIKTFLDEKSLKEIALKGGGEYFRIGRGSFDTRLVAAKIKAIEKTSIGERRHESMIDRFQLFLAAGLFCLLFAFILPERRKVNVS